MSPRALGLALVVWLLAAPLGAIAQTPGAPVRVGYLAPGPRDCPLSPAARAFERALRDAMPGAEIEVARRCHAGAHLLPRQVAELLELPVAALVAVGPTAAREARQAAGSVPVVFSGVPDPVQAGLVASLARPGGTVAGVAVDPGPAASAERLVLLKEALPALSKAGVLWSSEYPGGFAALRALEEAAGRRGVKLQAFELRGPRDVERALDIMSRDGTGGMIVEPGPVSHGSRRDIIEGAAKGRLPAIYPARLFVDGGGLMSWGPEPADDMRRAAILIQKIVAGAKPGDLPVEPATRLELAVNPKSAKALGFTLPAPLLRRAAHTAP